MEFPLCTAETWLSERGKTCKSQIEREIAYAFRVYPRLAPAMFICCDRLAFDGAEDPNLRITFDSRVLFRREALSLSAGAWGESLLAPGERLMEIKMPGAMPLWLSKILDEVQIYPTSFSKYGRAYTRFVTEARNGGIGNAC